MICLWSFTSTGPAAFLPQRSQITVHCKSGPKRITLVPLEIAIRRTDELSELFIQLHNVTVRIDDSIIRHVSLLMNVCLRIAPHISQGLECVTPAEAGVQVF